MSASPQPEFSSTGLSSAADADVDNKSAANDTLEVDLRAETSHLQFVGRAQSDILAKRQSILLQVIADFSSEQELDRALIATSNTLKNKLKCTRVSFGLYEQEKIRVVAISQQANIDEKTSETALLAAAMQETAKQDAVIDLTSARPGENSLQAHRLLAAGRTNRQIVSAPICHEEACLAVLCIEHDTEISMSSLTLQLVRNIADALAPLISVRQTAERGLARHARDRFLKAIDLRVAPKKLKLKLGLLSVACLILLASVIQMPYSIKANAELVPLERRVISAPRDGYIKSVETGAGDTVVSGDILLQLDTAELLVEKSRWNSELSGSATEMRSAMAERDRRLMAVLGAERAKLAAQLELLESQLERSVVRAPVSGVIVSGDLSQMVGAPVQRGQVLLELAPPDGYDVHLMVDEKDINRISLADSGRLSLKALSGERMDFRVTTIHPIGVAENGVNRFRVEASLTSVPEAMLLPGQTGVGKIQIGSASSLWVMTHGFTRWLRQKAWEWFG